MTAISNYLETEIFDHVFRGASYSPVATPYLSLHSASPGEAGGNEIATAGYARQSLPSGGAGSFSAASGRATANTAVKTFGPYTADPPEVTHFGIYDAATNGNLLMYGALDAASNLFTGDGHQVIVGALDISLGQLSASPLADVSTYLANTILNWLFRGGAFTTPASLQAALYSTNPGVDDTGNELADGPDIGYTRETIAFDAPTDGVGTNSGVVTFGPAGNTWTAVSHMAIFDNSGNLLTFGSLTGFTLTAGQSRTWAAGEITAQVA